MRGYGGRKRHVGIRRKRAGKLNFRVLLCIIIAAAAVIAVLFLTGVIDFGKTENTSAESSGGSVDEEIADYYEGVDEETLKGLTGEAMSSGDTVDKGNIIGLSALSPNEEERSILESIDAHAAAAVEAGEIAGFQLYEAGGDENQQMQDVISMINDGVKTLIVTGTNNYNFQKIAQFAEDNGAKIIACNVDAQSGFEVNIISQQDSAGEFAAKAAEGGASEVYTIDATETEVNAIGETVKVIANIDGETASSDVSARLEESEQISDLIVFDNSANSILKTFIKKGSYPHSISSPAYVGFVKTWHDLISASGVTLEDKDEDGSVTKTYDAVKAAKTDFFAVASTEIENLGEIVYKFAYNISVGKTLPEENYVYTIEGAEYVTNENIDEYYAKIGDMGDREVLKSSAEDKVDALFE